MLLRRICLCDFKGKLMTARCTLTDALIESAEGLLGILQTSGSDVGAKNDTSVVALVNAIPGLEHGTMARHDCVV